MDNNNFNENYNNQMMNTYPRSQNKNQGCLILAVTIGSFVTGILFGVAMLVALVLQIDTDQNSDSTKYIENQASQKNNNTIENYSITDSNDNDADSIDSDNIVHTVVYELLYDLRYGNSDKWIDNTVVVAGKIKNPEQSYVKGDVIGFYDDESIAGYSIGDFAYDCIWVTISNDEQAAKLSECANDDNISLKIHINSANSILSYTSDLIQIE